MLTIRKMMKSKKGFTLIELIVVIAILGILAAVAIPRFANIRDASKVKADASTAGQIINAARIYETDTDETPTLENMKDDYINPGTPQSGGEFDLVTSDSTAYKVTWEATGAKAGKYAGTHTVTENVPFDIDDIVTTTPGDEED